MRSNPGPNCYDGRHDRHLDIGTFLDADPGYYGGRPFIRGKRVTVQRIGIQYKEGRTPEETAEAFALTLPEVHAALAYYLANKEAIDEDLERQDAELDRLAEQYPRRVLPR